MGNDVLETAETKRAEGRHVKMTCTTARSILALVTLKSFKTMQTCSSMVRVGVVVVVDVAFELANEAAKVGDVVLMFVTMMEQARWQEKENTRGIVIRRR